LYKQVLKQTEGGANNIDSYVLSLLKAHCQNGLARLALLENRIESTRGPVAQDLAEVALAEAISVRVAPSVPFFLWTAASASGSSALFHLNVARQLVADSLVRASRPSDAESFLEDAVRDNPSDFDAAFALGAFRLRMTLYETDTQSSEEAKMAQTQLLKSARIDSGKAGPFALLGMWYEVQKDLQRAFGCYSKALLLDPSNPSAGRGVLRLKSFTEVQKICETATNSNSPVSGWAWRVIGQHKAMVENDDELAILCFHTALRCRDIECPQNEPLSVFFAPPRGDKSGLSSEFADVWADLAGCYRRVGRYAAAVRAFNSAWQADGDNLSSTVFCSWAQGKQLLVTKNLRQ
jgi:tetratricopeptide (TPR) repeat protein